MRLQLLRLTLLSSLVSLIACAPFKERDILKLDPDKVVGFPETVPNTTIGRLMLSHKPYLAIHNGCMSFPAVDKDGNAG